MNLIWAYYEGKHTSCLLASRVMRATKHDICSRKSIKTAIQAYMANTRTAGILVNTPRPKATHSDMLVSRILGPTCPTVSLTMSSTLFVSAFSTLCHNNTASKINQSDSALYKREPISFHAATEHEQRLQSKYVVTWSV